MVRSAYARCCEIEDAPRPDRFAHLSTVIQQVVCTVIRNIGIRLSTTAIYRLSAASPSRQEACSYYTKSSNVCRTRVVHMADEGCSRDTRDLARSRTMVRKIVDEYRDARNFV